MRRYFASSFAEQKTRMIWTLGSLTKCKKAFPKLLNCPTIHSDNAWRAPFVEFLSLARQFNAEGLFSLRPTRPELPQLWMFLNAFEGSPPSREAWEL
jgi:hypothetical protein